MTGFNETEADGQIQAQGARVVELVETMAEVTVSGSHGSLLLGEVGGLLVGIEGGQNLRAGAPPQAALLGAPPVVGSTGTTGRGGGRQVFADMVKIHERMGLFGKGPPGFVNGSIAPHRPRRKSDFAAPSLPLWRNDPSAARLRRRHRRSPRRWRWPGLGPARPPNASLSILVVGVPAGAHLARCKSSCRRPRPRPGRPLAPAGCESLAHTLFPTGFAPGPRGARCAPDSPPTPSHSAPSPVAQLGQRNAPRQSHTTLAPGAASNHGTAPQSAGQRPANNCVARGAKSIPRLPPPQRRTTISGVFFYRSNSPDAAGGLPPQSVRARSAPSLPCFARQAGGLLPPTGLRSHRPCRSLRRRFPPKRGSPESAPSFADVGATAPAILNHSARDSISGAAPA